MAGRVVAVHQPIFLPYLGVVRKIMDSDMFVVLDDVQFVRREYMNRNKILTKDGACWLTVPVKKAPQTTEIRDIEISYERDWQKIMLKTLEHAYGKAPFFDETMEVLEPLFEIRPKMLVDLNVALLERILSYLDSLLPMYWSSDFEPIEDATQRLLDRVERVGGSVYLSGTQGREYMKGPMEVSVLFQDYVCKPYPQLNSSVGFVPKLSVVDYLMNMGNDSSLL